METGKMGKDAADSIQVAAAGKICETGLLGQTGRGRPGQIKDIWKN